MSAIPTSDPGPPPKTVMPPLDARAPRPPVVRLRRGVVVAATMGAATLLAGSLAWAFVVQPELRERSHPARAPSDARGAVRASEVITDHPATYAQLDELPEPRQLGRAGASTGGQDAPDQTAPAPPRHPSQPTRDTTRAVRAQARESGLFFATSTTGGATRSGGSGSGSAANRDYAAVYNTHSLLAPLSPYELKAGAILPAVLLSGVDTARGGPVVASLTDNIRDTVSGRHLLIPQGARLIGRHEGASQHGDKRAFLVWERLILPNGKSLILEKEAGVDAQGTIGVEGQVDHRLFPLAVATLFSGAITALGQVARDRDDHSQGWWGDAGDAASIEAAQVGGKLIDRELDVRPTIRLRPGTRVRVLLTRDLILEPYGT